MKPGNCLVAMSTGMLDIEPLMSSAKTMPRESGLSLLSRDSRYLTPFGSIFGSTTVPLKTAAADWPARLEVIA